MNIKFVLRATAGRIGNILPFDYRNEKLTVLDFSGKNKELASVVNDVSKFSDYVNNELRKNGARIGIGKYNEDRVIYTTGLFTGSNPRTIHLGVDLFVKPGTPVLTPLDGRVHSFKNNDNPGDYGPTIILEHELNGNKFYTLYGHLSMNSLTGLSKGRLFSKGEMVGTVGTYPSNGNWPSHVHFQIITDMRGKEGDYEGVSSKETINEFLKLCPNPNLMLQIKQLGY